MIGQDLSTLYWNWAKLADEPNENFMWFYFHSKYRNPEISMFCKYVYYSA
jgi:hypothetical protein